MILPLFNAILILIYYEKAKTSSWRTLRLLVSTFKRFLLIPKNTSTSLVYEMIGVDIPGLVARNVVNSEEKWEARKDGRSPDVIPKADTPNYLRGIPNEWCQILKQQCSICPVCKNGIRNEHHMSTTHNIDIFDYTEVWTSIKKFHDRTVELHKKKKSNIYKVKRTVFLEYWSPRLKQLKEDTAYQFSMAYGKPKLKS